MTNTCSYLGAEDVVDIIIDVVDIVNILMKQTKEKKIIMIEKDLFIIAPDPFPFPEDPADWLKIFDPRTYQKKGVKNYYAQRA